MVNRSRLDKAAALARPGASDSQKPARALTVGGRRPGRARRADMGSVAGRRRDYTTDSSGDIERADRSAAATIRPPRPRRRSIGDTRLKRGSIVGNRSDAPLKPKPGGSLQTC
jgi:hypothetical protein